MSEAALLTARQLVGKLHELGVGTWTADAVRQWIREEPACPIAQHADQGKPHRYGLGPVLAWLRDRALRERAKGFTRGDGDDLVARIERALARAGGAPLPVAAAPVAGQGEFFAPSVAPPAGEGGAAAPELSLPPAPARSAAGQFTSDPTELPTQQVFLEILQGRDPRNWKAAEEALRIRVERQEKQRELIPAPELELALETQVAHFRAAVESGFGHLKQRLRDAVPPELANGVLGLLTQGQDALLAQLASSEDLGDVDEVAA